MTNRYSSIIWSIIPGLKIIQYPWRFLSFTIIGTGFFSAYFISKIPVKYQLFSLLIIPIIFLTNIKYFSRLSAPALTLQNKFFTKNYLIIKSAYQIPEYLPKSARYDEWQKYKGASFTTPADGVDDTWRIYVTNMPNLENIKYHKKFLTSNSGEYLLNISYFPFWQIKINGDDFKPTKFDALGRPIINLESNSRVEIKYQQTTIEILGNLLSVLGLIIVIILLIKKQYFIRVIRGNSS